MTHSGQERRSGARRDRPHTRRTQSGRGEQAASDAGQGLRRWYSAKRPVLRAVMIFFLLMGAFYAFVHTPANEAEFFHPYHRVIAAVTGGCLNVLGYDTVARESTVESPQFSMKIVQGCDAIEPVAAFAAAVLASPVSSWAKVAGVAVGTLSLLIINLLRVVSLFLVGVHFPKALDTMHYDVWQAAFIALAIVLWAVWVQWATRRRAMESSASH